MSLVASASIWNNDETTNKKRQSTMRKTIKLRSNNQDVPAYNDSKLEFENINKDYKTNSIEEQQDYNTSRNKRVNDLLNKITTVDDNNDNKMGDFKPLSHPSINVKKDIENTNPNSHVNYRSNDSASSIFSNYNKSYEPPSEIVNKPYFLAANHGLNASTNLGSIASHNTSHVSHASQNNAFNDKIMEKLNHMIHLLEETRHEKTANITEEFILYTFLGVFVIFIVDSFSRAKRYTR
jgi:hypothetical protein